MKFKLKYEAPFGDVGELFSVPTGKWRHKRPVIKARKCSQCGWCYLYCPGGSINEEEDHFTVDLKYCKGCGTCADICPANAIIMIEEAEEDGS